MNRSIGWKKASGSEVCIAIGMLSAPAASHIGSKRGIVDADQFSRADVLPQIESQGLHHLDAVGAGLLCICDEVGLYFGIGRLADPGEGRLSEHQKPSRMGRLQFGDRLAQSRSVSSRKIHHRTDVLAIHDGQALFGCGGPSQLAGGIEIAGHGNMSVEVEQRIACARHPRFGRMQHALRLILFERQAGAALLRLGTCRDLRRQRRRGSHA